MAVIWVWHLVFIIIIFYCTSFRLKETSPGLFCMLGSFFNTQIIFQSLIGGWRNISLGSGALWKKFGLLRTIFLKNDWLLARLLNVVFFPIHSHMQNVVICWEVSL